MPRYLLPGSSGESQRIIGASSSEIQMVLKLGEILVNITATTVSIRLSPNGGGEIEGFGEAAEEGEMSPRRVSEEAGSDEPLDKTTFEAFSIRQLRIEYLVLKTPMTEGKGLVKQPMHEMRRPGEQMNGKVGIQEGDKEAINRTVTEAEEKTKKYSEEQEALKPNLIEAETRIRQLIFEKDKLSKNHDPQGRVNTPESDR